MLALENPTQKSAEPLNFGVKWERPGNSFFSSLKAVFTGPKPPGWSEASAADSPMRVTWIRGPLPGRAITASSFSHVAFIFILLLPIWKMLRWERPAVIAPDIHLTWDAFVPDLPPISPTVKLNPISSPESTPAPAAADESNPRQTILSEPNQITHPRQTLIQPDAPPEPPKVVPQLPNIVQWGSDTPAPPKLQIAPSDLKPILRNVRKETEDAPQIQSATAHPDSLDLAKPESPDVKIPVNTASAPVAPVRRSEEAAVPEIENHAPDSAALNIASSAPDVPRPKLQVSASSARLAPRSNSHAEVAAAPDISNASGRGSGSPSGGESSGGDTNLRRIIALSATPAPPSEAVQVPNGNLAARISIGSKSANGGNGTPGGKSATGPPGVYVSSTQPGAGSPIAGNSGATTGGLKPATPRLGMSRTTKPALPDPNSEAHSDHEPRDLTGFGGEVNPEKILSGKRVYTTNINLPNLTSAKGSWILNFAELEPKGSPTHVHTDLSAPVVQRAVDPKYPTSLIKQHVEGEVVLYAIIRENGSVDSIQTVKRLDPQLDHNAIEAIANWKFSPASRNGEPVAVEVVIRIPFNAPPQQ
ncbi:MAG TPA: TonB family protein [Candidatus Acidoferrales bacterium]